MADEEVAYVAGMLEAKLTGPLLLMHWKNTMAGYCSSSSPPSPYCDKLEQFLSENNDFVTEQIAKEDSDYWYQVSSKSTRGDMLIVMLCLVMCVCVCVCAGELV